MRAPKSWIAEYAALPDGMSGRELGEALVTAGLEVEAVDAVGRDIEGPLVIGRVLEIEEEPQTNGKTIRWCQVDVGDGVRGIVCGADNFDPGDHVLVALPGTTLPGGFTITARATYGHVSDGMICAEDELGLGDDHTGILVLPPTDDAGRPWVLGADALEALGVRDDVLDMPVTPDMGYCLSIRGLAREAAQALDVRYTDPVSRPTPPPTAAGHPVLLQTEKCPLFVAVTVEGFDPAALTPAAMATRLRACGMRSISLSVDVSNYVMLETGQPNHCYDADALRGPIVVRQARPGERLVTLDDVDRALSVDDIVIADDRGPIGLGGVMGGEETELRATTTRIVIEAANFDPVAVARTSRRHKLGSEASRRFERGADAGAAYAAAHRVADLLVRHGGGRIVPEETVAGHVPPMPTQTMDAGLPARILGMEVPPDRVAAILTRSGVDVVAFGGRLSLTPPTWRHDLVDPYDYVEEVGCKVGLDHLPSIVPTAPVGHGLTTSQRLRRAIDRALATSGSVEVLTFPFGSSAELDAMGVGQDDPLRRTVRLANPLADTAPLLRTSLLPGLFAAVQRNTSRGNDDLVLHEIGRVFWSTGHTAAPLPGVANRPTQAELDAIERALPEQPWRLGLVLAGDWRRKGWQGAGEPAGWSQALGLASVVTDVLGVELTATAATRVPWHPGRCAELAVSGVVVGHAGELHPNAIAAFGLPARAAAVELDLDLLISLFPGPGSIRPISPFPVAKEDVALIVDEAVSVAALTEAVRDGAGPLLEGMRLFDVYRGTPVPEGQKSAAFSLRFRAPDRTLTENEVAAARDAAVDAARRRWGAQQRTT